MRIERIELRHTKIELVSPFETSLGVELFEEHIIVQITAGGVTGWGECVVGPVPSYSYETLHTAWHIIQDFIIPSILGKEFSNIANAIESFSWIREHRMAKAGVEAALSDAFAKHKGMSLSKYLGGTFKKIPVGVSVGLQSSPKELVKIIGEYLNDGYKRIKIKIAPGRDLDLIQTVRKEYPNIHLQVDANSAYTLNDIDMLKKFDEYNLQLIEQPLEYDDIYNHSLLQKELKTPICLDESINSIADTLVAIELGSCKIINIKPGRVGGFTESVKIHDLCKSKQIPVWHGGMDESGIGRAGNVALASLSNFILPGDISASKRYYKKDIVEPEFTLNNDGTMDVPNKPGIGVEVNMNTLNSVTMKKAVFKK